MNNRLLLPLLLLLFYAPFSQLHAAVGDQFLDGPSGLKFEVLTEGESNTVQVIRNSYRQSSYSIPESISYNDIAYTVTTIGGSAFANCYGLTSITITDSITSIGDRAFSYCLSLNSITIPDSVTSIGDYAFYCCEGLTSITIPDSVTVIGDYVFTWSKNLSSIILGNSIRSIGDYAFRSCHRLTSITIPDTVTSIGSYCFKACDDLTSINLPASMVSIGYGAFNECKNLAEVTVAPENLHFSGLDGVLYNYEMTKLLVCPPAKLVNTFTIPESVVDIGDWAFSSCSSITSISIPESVTTIGEGSFLGCTGLTTITIPDSVTLLGHNGFEGCEKLSSIILGHSIRSIGNATFRRCSALTEITIPDSVTSIGWAAFANCSNLEKITVGKGFINVENLSFHEFPALTEINVPADHSTFKSIDGVLYNNELTRLVAYPRGRVSAEFTIPDSVTAISSYAFYECSKLSILTLGAGITDIDDFGFKDFLGLTYISVSPESELFKSIDGVLYNADLTTLLVYPPAKPEGSFLIPDSVTRIEEYGFAGSSTLVSVTIPDSVRAIGRYAFYDCAILSNLSLPDTLTAIGYDAFGICYNLKSLILTISSSTILTSIDTINGVSLPNGEVITGIKARPGITFTNATDVTLKVVDELYLYNLPAGESHVFGSSAPAGASLYETNSDLCFQVRTENGENLAAVVSGEYWQSTYHIPETITFDGVTYKVTEIAEKAFYDCDALEEITMGDSVALIGPSAFANCSNLTTVSFSQSLTRIAERAFSDCSSLSAIILPDSLITIEESAFFFCTGLTAITLPKSLSTIEDSAFLRCYELDEFDVAEGNTHFINVDGVIYDTAQTSLFFYSKGKTQTHFTVPKTVQTIGVGAFERCAALTSIELPESLTTIGNNAFYHCAALTELHIPNSVTYIGYTAVYWCTSLQSVTLPEQLEEIPPACFQLCQNLRSITLPNSIKKIGRYAFAWSALQEIQLSESLISIESAAFDWCDLTSITIPASVTFIDRRAFSDCDRLTSIEIPDSITSMDPSALSLCDKLSFITLAISKSQTLTNLSQINGVTVSNFKQIGKVLGKPGLTLTNASDTSLIMIEHDGSEITLNSGDSYTFKTHAQIVTDTLNSDDFVNVLSENMVQYESMLSVAENIPFCEASSDALQELVDAVNAGEQIVFCELTPGWNLISSPFAETEVIGHGQIYNWHEAGYYEIVDGNFEPGRAYWIYNDQDISTTLGLTGLIPENPTVTYQTGWNLFGPVFDADYHPFIPADGLAPLDFIYSFENAQYQLLTTEAEIQPGQGYWGYAL